MGSRPPMEGAILRGEGASYCKVWEQSAVNCAKTAEPIEIPFGLWSWMGSRNHALDGNAVVLRDVAMATNFATKIAITDFVGMIATRQLVMDGFKWLADRMQIFPILCT